ncbi:hypothetical protein KC207_10635 [Phycicoccus sp. BSK3Z-2]|uniref:Uncharacterized protein n=1 Tax=Phycicoccus avicenniae TaxID=2828860 RepID=A0A941DAC5_9MICO|nr:hypothetical protein [Phycicoccus avicenniae]MBR7743745.1 hypothetical protein [Phycicoccus avicenniae]
MVHKPAWFKDDQIFVSFAETVGINKDGLDLFVIDPITGARTSTIDDRVSADVDALLEGELGPTSRWVPTREFPVAVPAYYDDRHTAALDDLLAEPAFTTFTSRSLGELIRDGSIERRAGHGSPSADMRNSNVPYIKVSDIRAGQININPSNLVPEVVAKRFWRGGDSGIRPFDLITPIRSSKNIGEFAVIMPGQERIVLTKEVLILRATADAIADNFYLLWALSLKVVRDQWRRVVFMQTNREDVGERFLEIRIPWPHEEKIGTRVSADFREYYQGVEALRSRFVGSLERGGLHHVFLGQALDSPDE